MCRLDERVWFWAGFFIKKYFSSIFCQYFGKILIYWWNVEITWNIDDILGKNIFPSLCPSAKYFMKLKNILAKITWNWKSNEFESFLHFALVQTPAGVFLMHSVKYIADKYLTLMGYQTFGVFRPWVWWVFYLLSIFDHIKVIHLIFFFFFFVEPLIRLTSNC